VFLYTGFAAAAIVSGIFLDIVYSTKSLITGLTDGSHTVFSQRTFAKGQRRTPFFEYTYKYLQLEKETRKWLYYLQA
jgi:hypothetical protein